MAESLMVRGGDTVLFYTDGLVERKVCGSFFEDILGDGGAGGEGADGR